jgi:methylenetetrahydrofolate reductase (NADPH)
MEVASLYADRKQWPVFSAETFPTENHRPIDPILRAVEELLPRGIRVVTTTWGALGSHRGGTASISRIIREMFGIPTVVHFIVQNRTRRDIEALLRGLYLDGLNNILALRGDPPRGVPDHVPGELRHRHASELVEQIVHLNRGLWMDDEGSYARPGVKTRFGIGVAGFPETHPEDLRPAEPPEAAFARNIAHLKLKIEAGAQYVVEQMIFDADLHFRYVKAARDAGIAVPIIPSILAFERYAQAARFVGAEHNITMPRRLREALQKAPEEEQKAIAMAHMAGEVRKLLDGGVPGIHFYCMNRSGPTIELLRRVKG